MGLDVGPRTKWLALALLSVCAAVGAPACGGSGTDRFGNGGSASGGTSGTGGTAASGGRGGSASGGATESGGSGDGAGTGGAAGQGGGGAMGADGGAGHAPGGHGGSAGAATAGSRGSAGGGGRSSEGGGTGTAGGTGTGGASGPVRIMAIGDSVTRATCWRDFLWQQLQQAYAGRVDFVGTLQADYGCGVSGFDSDNQGYSSSLITEVVAGVTNARTCDPYCPNMSNLQTAFASAKPQVVLMHWGTNDVWNGKSSTTITTAYSTVIDALRTANPSVVILLAQIIPMNVTGATCSGCSCASCSSAIPALNTAITTFAAGKTTAQSPVIVVDQYTGFDVTADTRDGVHPNTQGSQKMASKWYTALTANQLVH
ncbi:MAG TPA: SGNH/GDSL hydrolase family protein [Polyangia bacterium]|nr:SGNH/GDSL hydrolase family protein [Polyangia bacterium]